MLDGTFIGLASNGNLMTLDSLGSSYVTLPNLDPSLVVKSIAVPGAGGLARKVAARRLPCAPVLLQACALWVRQCP